MANLIAPMVTNQDVTADFINTSVDNMRSVKFLVEDLTVNNVALAVYAPELSLLVVANATYIFNSCLFYDTSAAADFKVNVLIPSGTALVSFWSSNTAITTVSNALDMSAQSALYVVGKSVGGIATGTVLCIRPAGLLRVGTASGLVTIGYAQDTPTAANSYLKQGSWMSLTRVA